MAIRPGGVMPLDLSDGQNPNDDELYSNALGALIELARTDFLTYWHLFNPQGNSSFILSNLHRYLIDRVQAIADGRASLNTAVSVPPQHGKSRMLSVEAPSWILGRFPTKRVAITGFSHQLVTKFSKDIRARMLNPLYQQIFPEVYPVKGSNKADDWVTTKGGSVLAKSSGSKLTGNRVDWLILDDVHPGRSEAESETLRRKVIEWYFADCVTRLHPTASQFLIGTRWHPDDLIGHLTSEEYVKQLEAEGADDKKFFFINIPALTDEENVGNDPLGRGIGEAAFPEERPVSFLKSIRASIPGYEWDSQFQGRPRSISSGVIDLSRLIFLDSMNDVPWDTIDDVVRGWDTALSEKQRADFSAGALCAHSKSTDTLYILHVSRKKLPWPKLKPQIVGQALLDLEGYPANLPEDERLKVSRLGMEGVSGFRGLVEEVRSELLGKVKVEMKNPPKRSEGGGSKLLRAQPWLNLAEAGKLVIVRGSWNRQFLDELEKFPAGKHDDQIDAVSICFEMMLKRGKLLLA